MNPLSRLLDLNNSFLTQFKTEPTGESSTAPLEHTSFLRNSSMSSSDIGSDVDAHFGSDFVSNLSKNLFSDFGNDPSDDSSSNANYTAAGSAGFSNSGFGGLAPNSFLASLSDVLSRLTSTASSSLNMYGTGNIDPENSDSSDDPSGVDNSDDDGSDSSADDGNGDNGPLGSYAQSLQAQPPNGSTVQLDMGPGGDTTGSQASNPGNWNRRSGKNDDPAFSSYFDPSMVNGNTLAIQGSQGSEVSDGSINPNRGTGTYYYSSKKNASDGIVQSGFLYGNGRKFEVDFDELDFGNPGDTSTQMASIYIDNDKKVEARYKASDLGFNNFSDQTMHFRAVINEGYASVQALNSQGNWQQITKLSNGTINSGTMQETDFKPFMSTWRMSGRPDDGQRHEMTGEMSFTPG